MTKEEIVEAARQLPLTERKLLLRDMVRAMREDIEVTNPPDKRARLERLDAIQQLDGFSGLKEEPYQSRE